MTAHPKVECQWRWVARTDDILCWMAIGIATVHPPAGVVVFAAFVNYLTDIGTLAALIAGTPKQHRRLVAVAQHHTAHTLPVHRNETLVA